MGSKIVSFLLFFLLICSVSAITLNPGQIDLTYKINERISGNILIKYGENTTSHKFNIYNVTIEGLPYLELTPIPILELNGSALLNYSVLMTEPISGSFNGNIRYFYYTNTTREPKNYTINVNATGFSPINKTIYVNDSIIWHNIDTSNHTATNFDNPSERVFMEAGDKILQNFDSIRNYQYYDEYTSIGGYINVLDNSILVYTHTPSLDMPIEMHMQYSSQEIETQIIPDTFKLNYNSQDEGILRLKTNDTLLGVHLSGDWLTFSENNFDLNKETKILTFTVKPRGITKDEHTDKQYNKFITIAGTNLITTNVEIPIFINMHNFTEDDDKKLFVFEPMTAEQTIKYCIDKYGDDRLEWEGLCNDLIQNESYPVEIERVINPSTNESDWIKVVEGSDKIIESNNRLRTALEQQNQNQNIEIKGNTKKVENLTNEVTGMKDDLTIVKDYVLNIKQNKTLSSILFWVLVFLVVIILGILGLSKWLKERKKVSTNMTT